MDSIFLFGTSVLLPIGICVVLPVLIIWFITRQKKHEADKRTEIALAAIERNAEINVEEFIKSLQPTETHKTVKEKLMNRLFWGLGFAGLGLGLVLFEVYLLIKNGRAAGQFMLFGLPSLFLGIGMIIAYYVSKKQLVDELKENEEEQE